MAAQGTALGSLNMQLGRKPLERIGEVTDMVESLPTFTVDSRLSLTAICCTYNPIWPVFRYSLESLKHQTKSAEQIIVVDNNSNPPVSYSTVKDIIGHDFQLIREQKQGLTYARMRAIQAAIGKILVFIDDDTELDANYLAEAVRIGQEKPWVGAWGGASFLGSGISYNFWVSDILPYLGVRDYGSEPITRMADHWGHWEPIGAGMCIRKSVADLFAEVVIASKIGNRLGRRGVLPLSGEDSLLARCGFILGYANSYEPSLRLTHHIAKHRFSANYLADLLEGFGRAHVHLERAMGRAIEIDGLNDSSSSVIDTFFEYRDTRGKLGVLMWYYQLGLYHEVKACDGLDEWDGLIFPKISVIVPNFNSGKFLRRALNSILNQNYKNYELILVDGGSTDESLEIIEEYRKYIAIVISEPDDGPADAINKGFARSTGQILCWLCSDDEYMPGTFMTVIREFRAKSTADIVIGACERVFPDGSTQITTIDDTAFQKIFIHNLIDQPSVFWKRSVFEVIGSLDTSFDLAFDWDYWARMATAGLCFTATNQLLSRYYFWENNKSNVAGRNHAVESYRIIHKYGAKHGLVALIYWIMYINFDLKGCFDQGPRKSKILTALFKLYRKIAAFLVSEEILSMYNWQFASKQERGLVWWR
jgi:glycosyltransferase involved in cell wall biosynthesis